MAEVALIVTGRLRAMLPWKNTLGAGRATERQTSRWFSRILGRDRLVRGFEDSWTLSSGYSRDGGTRRNAACPVERTNMVAPPSRSVTSPVARTVICEIP